jgi:nitroimidazol reductase NimA-like FMN-containing flavoprotein (pyridoxamine 5'-phosphate oxidase superfamily)
VVEMSMISSGQTAAADADNHRAWPSPPDPGDLSRRLAVRRAELRLSIPQVARQAQVSARYLEYLEKFPAQPDTIVLRRLAAALRTTPAALLGAGWEEPGGRAGVSGYADASGQLEGLFPAECRRLLAPGGVGRIAFVTAAGLMVLPVNYVIASSTVVLRTGTGSLIAAHGDGQVAFEADHLDEAQGQGWSVLVRGRAHRVLQPGELRNLKHECEPRPWSAGEHDLYIRIIPEHISGRRIRTQ